MNPVRTTRRRGAVIAVMVLLLAAVQMVALTTLGGSADETDQAVRRILAARAQFAADGAGAIVARQVRDGLTVPAAGTTWTIGSATARVVSAPHAATAGAIVIDVTCDRATRRVRITLEAAN